MWDEWLGQSRPEEEAISCNPELLEKEKGQRLEVCSGRIGLRAALEQGTARNIQGEDLS